MTRPDYERHAARMFSDPIELASRLGAHEFRCVTPPYAGRTRQLVDAVSGEPIAIVTEEEARELATWLETERPLTRGT